MIINCPIYLEVEEKFTPVEGREFTLQLRKLVLEQLQKSSGGKFRIKTDQGRVMTIKILSEAQAVARFGNPLKKVDDPPQPKELI